MIKFNKINAIVDVCLLAAQLHISDTLADCQTSCLNGGTLQVLDDRFSCSCPAPYYGFRCQNGCTVQLKSWGRNDAGPTNYPTDATGYIKINNQLIIDTSMLSSGWVAGPTIVGIDPVTCANVTQATQFNLWNQAANTQKFIDFVNSQKDGTILLAVTSDDSYSNFSPAYNVIKSLGGPALSDANFNFRGKYIFVVQKGFPSKGISSVAKAGGSPITLNVTVTARASTDVTINSA